MKINLKKLAIEIEILNKLYFKLTEDVESRPMANKLQKTITFLNEIALDLEMGGESIIELDKPRLDAIKEKNSLITRLNNSDDNI
jgi:hypothetical protein